MQNPLFARTPASLACSLILSIAWIAARTAQAQVPYEVTHSQGTWQPITNATSHMPTAYSGFDPWDEGAVEISLPFPVNFFEREYRAIWAYTNGFASFMAPPVGSGVLRAPSTIPSPNNGIHDFIGVMWQDLNNVSGTSNASIRSTVSGSPGDRVVTIEWAGFERYETPGSSVNFQIRLHEGTSMIEVIYGPNSGVENGTTAIENFDGTDGKNLLAPSATCDAACACLPAQCGQGNWRPEGRTITISWPRGAELVGSLAVPPGATPGTSFVADISIRNLGLEPAGAFRYRLLLTDNNISASPVLVDFGTFTAPELAPSRGISEQRALTIPASFPRGVYYLALIIDDLDQVRETLETNNTVFSSRLATGPDLVADLSAPRRAGPGEVIDVELRLRSQGSPVVQPVNVRLFFSTDQALDANDVAVEPSFSLVMSDGFEHRETLRVPVPLSLSPSPPPYWLIAEVDPDEQVAEVDETNNVAVAPQNTTVETADLEIASFEGGEFAFVGLPSSMVATVTNKGGSTARNFSVCVFVSRSIVVNVFQDACIAEAFPVTLAPGQTQVIAFRDVIQLEPTCNAVATSTGSFYVAAVADCRDAITESVETNNVKRADDTLRIRWPAPDFVATSVESSSRAAAGETFPVLARIANLGNQSGEAALALVLSENPGATIEDVVIHRSSAPLSLNPPAESTYNTWAEVPADLPSGAYYLGVVVDPDQQVEEIREGNNVLAVGPIVVEGNGLGIVSPRPPAATIGVPYTFRFSAVGGSETYRWTSKWLSPNGTSTEAPAPEGLSFDPLLGELSGVPGVSAEGRHDLEVQVQSGALKAIARHALIITSPTVDLTVVSRRLPPALVGADYSVQLVAVGGTPPYRWKHDAALPIGLGLSSDGVLGGEPVAANAYTISVIVEDSLGGVANGSLALDVVDETASITIETADVADARVGRLYEMKFRAANGRPPYVWTIEGDEIPGLAFEAQGRLVGTPSIAGEYNIVVQAQDEQGLIDRNAYVLKVIEEGALRIVLPPSSNLPVGYVGKAYLNAMNEEVRLEATSVHDSPVVRWTILEGALPPGLTLASETGALSGVPEVKGAYAFLVLARDERNDIAQATLVLEIKEETTLPPANPGCACSTRGETGVHLEVTWMLAVLLAVQWMLRRMHRGLRPTREATSRIPS